MVSLSILRLIILNEYDAGYFLQPEYRKSVVRVRYVLLPIRGTVG